MSGPLGPSLAPYIRSSRTLSQWLKPVATWYANLAGYRKLGLVYDDLRTSHNPTIKLRALLVLWWRGVRDSQCSQYSYLLIYAVVEERPDVQRVRTLTVFSFGVFLELRRVTTGNLPLDAS